MAQEGFPFLPVTNVVLMHEVTTEELEALNFALEGATESALWLMLFEIVHKAQNDFAEIEIVADNDLFMHLRISYDGNSFELPAGWFSFESHEDYEGSMTAPQARKSTATVPLDRFNALQKDVDGMTEELQRVRNERDSLQEQYIIPVKNEIDRLKQELECTMKQVERGELENQSLRKRTADLHALTNAMNMNMAHVEASVDQWKTDLAILKKTYNEE